MSPRAFAKTSWHFQRFLHTKGVSYEANPNTLYVDMHEYVDIVLSSLAKTYIFNGGIPLSIIFALISFERVYAVITTWWPLLAFLMLSFLGSFRLFELRRFNRLDLSIEHADFTMLLLLSCLKEKHELCVYRNHVTVL